MIEKTCDYCKKPFEVPNYKKDKARFCSRTCGGRSNRGKHQSEETRKKRSDTQKNPFKTGRIKNTQLICEYCEKPFKVYNYLRNIRRFCSNVCRIKAIKAGKIQRHYSEEGLRKISQARKGKHFTYSTSTRVQIICEVCKKPFEVDNYRKDKAKFCSRVCCGASRRKQIVIKEISECKFDKITTNSSIIKRVKEKTVITCEVCNKQFVVQHCRKDKARFCSNKCRGVWISQNIYGDKIYNYKKKIEKTCLECDKVFYIHTYRKDGARFCSKKCSNTWHARNRHKTVNKLCKGCGKEFEPRRKYTTYCSKECRKAKIQIVCRICGKVFRVYRYEKHRKFCSKECMGKSLKGVRLSIRTEFKKGRILSEEHQKKCIKALHQKPNKLEKNINSLLDKYFPNEWKYVGSGEVIINGLCPDFIHNNKKLIIEVFGDRFHDQNKAFFKIGENAKEGYRIKKFAECGYSTLILWESDIKKKTNIELISIIKNWRI